MGTGGVILTRNELVLTFGDLHLCVKFGENRQRNATVRVTIHGQTDRHTHRQIDANRFIICPMLYAIAMGQIKNPHMRTISLNVIFFKNPRDASQVAILARQMYPSNWKFVVEHNEMPQKNHWSI